MVRKIITFTSNKTKSKEGRKYKRKDKIKEKKFPPRKCKFFS